MYPSEIWESEQDEEGCGQMKYLALHRGLQMGRREFSHMVGVGHLVIRCQNLGGLGEWRTLDCKAAVTERPIK